MSDQEESGGSDEFLRDGVPNQCDLELNLFDSKQKNHDYFCEEWRQAEPTGLQDSQNVIDHEGGFYGRFHQGNNEDDLELSNQREEISNASLRNQSSQGEQPSQEPSGGFQAKKNTAKPKNRKKKKHKKILKIKNSETKNIPKNYGKQLIKFSLENKNLIEQKVFRSVSQPIRLDSFVSYLKLKKKSMNKISDLRSLWIDETYGQALRMISMHFLRVRCYEWIYNSRIEDRSNPLKYRPRIMQGVKKPDQFMYLKEY